MYLTFPRGSFRFKLDEACCFAIKGDINQENSRPSFDCLRELIPSLLFFTVPCSVFCNIAPCTTSSRVAERYWWAVCLEVPFHHMLTGYLEMRHACRCRALDGVVGREDWTFLIMTLHLSDKDHQKDKQCFPGPQIHLKEKMKTEYRVLLFSLLFKKWT